MKIKKIAALGIAVIMSLALGLTALAAPSPSVSGVVTSGTATDKTGKRIEIRFGEVPAKYKSAVDELNSAENLKNLLGDAYVDGMTVIDVKDITTISSNVEFPVTITFKVPGVTPSSKVAILCYNKDKGIWEVVPCEAGDGTITATFDYLSLVAFVVDKDTLTSTSPKTGESTTPVALMAVIMLAAGGVYVLSRKSRA